MRMFVLALIAILIAVGCAEAGPRAGSLTPLTQTVRDVVDERPLTVPVGDLVDSPIRNSEGELVDNGGVSGVIAASHFQTRCCYIEGSLALLEILDARGVRIAPLAVAGPSFEDGEGGFVGAFEPVTVPDGQYAISIWQYVCPGGACSDDPAEWDRAASVGRTDLCATEVDIASGARLTIVATWTPGLGCREITVS